MNKLKYWKKKYNFYCSMYDNHENDMKDDLLRKIYRLIGDLGDYIYHLEEE